MPEIDVSAFEAAYKEALPDELEQVKTEVKVKTSGMGFEVEAMPFFDISSIGLGTFCTQWPKVKKFLNMAIGFASLFAPSQAAMAKAFIKAFETTILPAVCPKP